MKDNRGIPGNHGPEDRDGAAVPTPIAVVIGFGSPWSPRVSSRYSSILQRPSRFPSYLSVTSYPMRRSIRLAGYDYSRSGAYFVTVCVEQRLPLLGRIVEDEVQLSAAGEMVTRIWANLGDHYPGVSVDASIVMPNHVHGILFLSDPSETGDGADKRTALSLSTVIQRFKTYTAHRYGQGVASADWPRYPGRLWQHRFYEHVIRHDQDLQTIREYIANNPRQWALDRLNPDQTTGP